MESHALAHWTTTVALRRRNFNPKKKADLEEFAYFQANHRWRSGCPFILEWPFLDVIAMCKDKFIATKLK
jgi:DnaJ-domain-containing protein 1